MFNNFSPVCVVFYEKAFIFNTYFLEGSLLMSTMIIEVYDALMAAGSPDDKSRAAATAMSTDILEMKRDVNLLKWMVGLNIAVSMIPALKAILG